MAALPVGRRAEPFEGDPNRMVDDPTSDGQITARMLHLYQQTIVAFPDHELDLLLTPPRLRLRTPPRPRL